MSLYHFHDKELWSQGSLFTVPYEPWLRSPHTSPELTHLCYSLHEKPQLNLLLKKKTFKHSFEDLGKKLHNDLHNDIIDNVAVFFLDLRRSGYLGY